MGRIEEQEKRIAAIFSAPQPPDLTFETLTRYYHYLEAHLQKPCQVTGIEAFNWEERYVFGDGSKQAYEQERRTKAAAKDIFELVKLDAEVDDMYGILAHVRRSADKRRFQLPLSDLKATDQATPNYELLDDFSVWFVNYR